MSLTLEQLRFLATDAGRAAILAAQACDAASPSAVAALRREFNAEQATAALQVVTARRRAAAKLGPAAADLIADAEAVEQASSAAVAAHKARRFADRAPGRGVWDLCCGLGADARALANAAPPVTAVDIDPGRAWMARRFAGCAALAADAATVELPPGVAWHMDPSRRSERGRAWRLTDYAPPPEAWWRLLRRNPHACLKLSPGVDLDDLDDHWARAALAPPPQVEFISESGRLVQALAWTGTLADAAPRAATVITPEATLTLAGVPAVADAAFHPADHDHADDPPARFLYAVDPAVERAGLLAQLADELGAPALHPRLGLLMSDRRLDSPLFTAFDWLAVLPFRPRKLRRWLAAHDAGPVEIKTRDQAVDPDPLQRQLAGPGHTRLTLFVLRFDRTLRTLAARRHPRAAAP